MRSKWKSPFSDIHPLKKQSTQTFVKSRRSTILPNFIGVVCHIYNGKTYVKRGPITQEMVGFKFGQFAATRKINVKKK